MRLVRILTALSASAVVVLSAVNAASAAPAAVRYTALGDSYAAGVGTADSVDTNCGRSGLGYPTLWANAHRLSSFTDATCSGATTSDVSDGQVNFLSITDTVVTVQVGGNDAGFTNVLTACVLGGDAACKSAVDNSVNYINTTLPGLLDNTYRAIRDHAPSATVYVLGYPHIYLLSDPCNAGMSVASRSYIDGGADHLDNAISAAAGRHGFRFVDVRSIFGEHGVCASSPWLNNVTSPLVNSFHPNATGYASGYLPALTSVTG